MLPGCRGAATTACGGASPQVAASEYENGDRDGRHGKRGGHPALSGDIGHRYDSGGERAAVMWANAVLPTAWAMAAGPDASRGVA